MELKINQEDNELNEGCTRLGNENEKTKIVEYQRVKEDKKGGILSNGHATWDELVEEEDERLEEKDRNKNSLLWIKVTVGKDMEMKAMVDSGATHSCMDDKLYEELKEIGCIEGELPVINLKLTLAAGKRKISVNKQVISEMIWSEERYNLVMLVVSDLFYPLVLGLDWLKRYGIIIDCKRNLFYRQDIVDHTNS